MAARALREALDDRRIPNVVLDLIDFSNDLFKWSYSDVYKFISEHAHLACKIMYELTDQDRDKSLMLRFVERISLENVKRFLGYVRENEPEICVCTHFFPANVLSRMKEEGLYRGRIYTVVTDFALHRMWMSPGVDRYFAASPIVVEDLCGLGVPRECISLTGIPVVVLRGFLIYGDSRSPGRLIPDLLASARSGAPFTLRDPVPRRDYLYIRDFAGLIRKILSMEPVPEGTYNVGGGEIHSNLDVAEQVRRIAPMPFDLVVADMPRRNDVDDIAVDIRLVKRTFGWEPRYSLDDGLGELLSEGPPEVR
jgi:hypothetical protein